MWGSKKFLSGKKHAQNLGENPQNKMIFLMAGGKERPKNPLRFGTQSLRFGTQSLRFGTQFFLYFLKVKNPTPQKQGPNSSNQNKGESFGLGSRHTYICRKIISPTSVTFSCLKSDRFPPKNPPNFGVIFSPNSIYFCSPARH